MKVVINKCWGGFSISLEAARFMAEKGNKAAQEEVKEYDDKVNNPELRDEFERELGVQFFGFGETENYGGYDRTDTDLIAAVETLKDEANGKHAKLKVVEIPEGTVYYIENYDGMESIHEVHMSWR